MHLLNLNIERLPGISTPFPISAGDGINLVLGPNESGKSSLVRAVLHLLWPDDLMGTPIVVQGQFFHGGKTYQATSDYNNKVTWTIDGNVANKPHLSADHVAGCYRLGVLDLMRSGSNSHDAKLALQIRLDMAGGYDLNKLGELIPDPVKAFSNKQKIWHKNRNRLRNIFQQQNLLSADQNQLQSLKEESKRASRAFRREQLIKQAIELKEAQVSISKLELLITEYSPGMENLQANDSQTLTSYYDELEEFRKQYEDQQDALNEINGSLQDLCLSPVSDSCNIGLVSEIIKNCRPLLITYKELARAVSGAQEQFASEENNIDPRVLEAGNDMEKPARDLFQNLSKLHAASITLEAALKERQNLAQESPLQSMHTDNDAEHKSRIIEAETIGKAVGKYLESGEFNAPLKSRLVLSCCIIFVGVVGFVFRFGNPLFSIPSGLAVGAGATLLFGWLKSKRHYESARKSLQDKCNIAGHPLPVSWTLKQARELLGNLDNIIIRTQTVNDARKTLEHSFVESIAQCKMELKQSQNQHRQILQKHNLPETIAQEDLLAAINALDRYLTARGNLAEHRGQLEECSSQIEDALKRGQQEFSRGEIIVDATIESLADAHATLKQKRDQRNALEGDLKKGQKQLDFLETNLENQQRKIISLLDRLGLPKDKNGTEAVASLIKEHEQYQHTQSSLIAVKIESERLKDVLLEAADTIALQEWQNLPIPELEILMENESELASKAEAMIANIATIETKIDTACNDKILGDAQDEERISHEKVVEVWEKRNEAALAKVLVQETMESFEQNSRPAILIQASRLFRSFTKNRYELRVTSGKGPNSDQSFQAISTDGIKKSRDLKELSDGTRAQLLLAVRLAFIMESESEIKLPLFLDESLTSSDPTRFAAIADSLAQWAQESSRQIFYLTSNPADVAAWKQVLENANLDAPHFIDLGSIRTKSTAADLDSFQAPAITSIAQPLEMSAAQYGLLLQIPKLDPWATENAASIFYFLRDDLNLLHKLLEAGVTTYGTWKSQSTQLVQAGIMTEEQQQNLSIRGLLLRLFLEAWQEGRGRIVTASDLRNSGILSPQMLGRAVVLLENVNGNSDAFIDGMMNGEIERLQSSQKEKLQNYLELEGFTDPRPELTMDQVVNHIVKSLTKELGANSISLGDIRTFSVVLEQTLSKQ